MPMLLFQAWTIWTQRIYTEMFVSNRTQISDQTQNDFTLPIPQSTDNSQNQIKLNFFLSFALYG